MRSVPRGSFERISSFRSLWRAWLTHRRGKRRRPAIAEFDLDADRHLLALHRDLIAGRYRPSQHSQKVVRDPKLRLVSAPALRDRVLHQAIVTELAPYFERSYIDDSYACRPGLGPHRAVLRHLSWTRTHELRMALDVRAYFQSIDHEQLLALWGRRIRDEQTLVLLRALVVAGGDVYRTELARTVLTSSPRVGTGMPVGSSLSQWAANLYLDGLDHFVKRELKVRAYLRYMDDFVLFADDQKTLARQRAEIEHWLGSERKLELNEHHGEIQPAARPTVFLGYRISRAGLAPSRKLRRRTKARVRRAARRGDEALVRTIRSYVGLLVDPC